MINVESAHGLTMSLSDLLLFKKIDILVVMETWLNVTGECITEISPPGNKIHYPPGSVGCDGGFDISDPSSSA